MYKNSGVVSTCTNFDRPASFFPPPLGVPWPHPPEMACQTLIFFHLYICIWSSNAWKLVRNSGPKLAVAPGLLRIPPYGLLAILKRKKNLIWQKIILTVMYIIIQFLIVKKSLFLYWQPLNLLRSLFYLYHYILRAFIDFQKIIIFGRGFLPRRSQKPYVFSDFRFLFIYFFRRPMDTFRWCCP